MPNPKSPTNQSGFFLGIMNRDGTEFVSVTIAHTVDGKLLTHLSMFSPAAARNVADQLVSFANSIETAAKSRLTAEDELSFPAEESHRRGFFPPPKSRGTMTAAESAELPAQLPLVHYAVCDDLGGLTTSLHSGLTEAKSTARQRAKEYPGTTFLVYEVHMKPLGSICLPTAPVTEGEVWK